MMKKESSNQNIINGKENFKEYIQVTIEICGKNIFSSPDVGLCFHIHTVPCRSIMATVLFLEMRKKINAYKNSSILCYRC